VYFFSDDGAWCAIQFCKFYCDKIDSACEVHERGASEEDYYAGEVDFVQRKLQEEVRGGNANS
jgi:hypothetical protein